MIRHCRRRRGIVIEEKLKEKVASFQWFSVAVVEGTDVSNTLELAIFV
jgi:hypothetical protein